MYLSVKLRFRPSRSEAKEGSLHYRLTIDRATAQRATSYKIYPAEWDERKGRIRMPPDASPRYGHLATIRQRLSREMALLHATAVRKREENEDVSADEIFEAFEQLNRRQVFGTFMQQQIEKQQRAGRMRTAEAYRSALQSFRRFCRGKEIMLYEWTSETAGDYERYLKNSGVSMNTVSFYMRILRAVFNKAVKQKLTAQTFPFQDVYTGIGQTAKRAMDIGLIRRIKELDLSEQPKLDHARDLFLLSFYFRGMSLIDMAYLEKKNLQRGILEYRRKKTGQRLTIKWEDEMQAIVDKYPENEPYLLPILQPGGEDDRKQYKRASKQINRLLKKVGLLANLPTTLTMYVARHSWASIARQKNIPISVISNGLGHQSEKTTRIYLAELDTSATDRANNEILADLSQFDY